MSKSVNIKEKFNEGMSEFAGHNYGRSIEILTEVLNLDPSHRIAMTARGSAFLKLDNLESAIRDFSSAIELDTNHARAYHLRGLAFEKQGNDKEALADFNRALEVDPEYGAAYFSRATLHSKLGHTDMATKDIEMVTHLTNRNIETFANESNVWRSQHLKLENILESDMNR